MTVSEYLTIVEEQIRQKSIAPELIDELRQHIEAQAAAYQEEGMEENAALLKAVEEMGDPVDTGVQLDMVHQPRTDKKLFLIIILGFLFSIVMVFINQRDAFENGNIIWLGLSICSFLSISVRQYRDDYTKHPFQMWCLSLISAMAFILLSVNTHIIQSLLNSSLMGFAIICYHYRNEGREGIYKLLVYCSITCMMTLVVCSFSYTYLILIAHVFIITLGIHRNWYKVSKKKYLIILWSIPALLIPALLTSISIDGHPQNGITSISEYLGNMNMPYGSTENKGLLIFALLGVLQITLFICMYLDIRKLTNQLCRIICTGVLTAFLVTYLQSLLCLFGYGSADQVYFPFFSPIGNTIDVGFFYYCVLSAIFLQFHRQDRVIPRRKPDIT